MGKPAAAAANKSLPIFRNQVGGHMPLLWNSGRICKPLMQSEFSFYHSLERELPDLVPFIPTYYGIMEVDQFAQQQKERENAAAAAATAATAAPTTTTTTATSDTAAMIDHKHALSISNSKPNSEANESILDDENDSTAKHRRSASAALAAAHSNGTQLYSAWGWTCKEKRWIEKMMADKLDANSASGGGSGSGGGGPSPPALMPDGSPRFLKYIVLEDLTYKYRNPCILDLKIGVRQHGMTPPLRITIPPFRPRSLLMADVLVSTLQATTNHPLK